MRIDLPRQLVGLLIFWSGMQQAEKDTAQVGSWKLPAAWMEEGSRIQAGIGANRGLWSVD